MCTKKLTKFSRLLCATSFLLGIILPLGHCQNAEPRESFGTRTIARRTEFAQHVPFSNDMDQSWDASPRGKKSLNENGKILPSRNAATEVTETEAEVPPQADGNRNADLLLAESVANSSPQSALNVSAATSSSRRKVNGGDRARKKRRRGKESKSMASYNQEREGTEDIRENEIRNKRGQLIEKGGNATSKKYKNLQERKYRAERRRRRKNRERKRGRKRSKQQSNEKLDGRRASKFKGRMNDAPAALFLRRNDKRENSSWHRVTETNSRNITSSTSNNRTFASDVYYDTSNGTVPSNSQDQLTTESNRKSTQTTLRYGNYGDTVEREFSKQLEKEISKTRIQDPASLENRILGVSLKQSTYKDVNSKDSSTMDSQEEKVKLTNSRYDASKMLGYSRTEEDLPILDMENEVLARTIKDYNAYITSSLKLSTMPRYDEIERHKHTPPRFHGKPIIDVPHYERTSGEKTSTTTYDEDNTENGDLSCINGTFLPAPLARHALIKYVKSSIPGHEYLEADYECAPGFYITSESSRLLCKNRQWVGQVPKCKPRQNSEGACAVAFCEHVCKEIDGRAVCSCYKGFQLEGNKCIDVNECNSNKGGCEYKCINTPGSFRCECPKGMRQREDRFTCTDINECLLNNGHGPCQDTCRNTIGGYECSCDNLLDTVLSPDNHTCQNSGPCSVNNAGCSHTCLSTMGRVFCLCPDGFILEDDWKTCQDVDECAQPDLQTEVCRYGCINTPGSYRCAEPMELKDQPVLDSLSITCLPGYEATPDGTCIDINECVVDNGGCTEVCENTDGSFFCACDGDEKALSSDGKSCVDINNVACAPLNPEGRGYLMCSRLATLKPWRGRRKLTNRPGTKCFLKCPHGYQLHGEYELACRSDGTWDGPKHGECVRYSKPRLECPKDVVAELPPGRDEAFVTFDQPSTDLDWFRYVRSKPSWGTRLEANLKPGVHEVTFFARHPVSKKQTSCVLRIIVKDGEAPKVKDCPKDIEVTGRNGSAITWTEPIFTDNVKVTRIKSNESPGRRFDIGGHRIEYEASDDAGWSSKCVFTVVLRQE